MLNNQIETIKKLLPHSPGVMNKEEYFNSAVIIPLVKLNNSYHFLFEKRAAHIRQGSEICFPGGEFDEKLDKDPTQTAVRETMEELGIQRKDINVLGLFDTFVGPMGVTVDPVIAELHLDDINNLNIDKNEVEKVFVSPVSFFLDNEPEMYSIRVQVQPYYTDERGHRVDLFPVKELNLPERYTKPWNMKNQPVFVYRTNGEVIWGITAVLIRAFLNKFGHIFRNNL